MKRRRLIQMLGLISALLLANHMSNDVTAAPGDLDPTFGFGGRVVSDFGGSEYTGDVLVQADGKIIVAGTSVSNIHGAKFLLIRYHGDGSLDRSFGGQGWVVTDFGVAAGAHSAVIQTDGRIVVAGASGDDFALARYNTDGTLDQSFGTGGRVITDFSGLPDSANALIIQPDGRIVAAGIVNVVYVNGNLLDPLTDADFGLVRYNPDGSLDASFGIGGKVSTEFNGRYDYIAALALQSDGKIVAAGFAATPPGTSNWDLWDNGLARYNSDGSVDNSFGRDGKVVTDWMYSGENGINAIVVQPDGSLFTAGYACHYDACYSARTRYTTNGTLLTEDSVAALYQGNITDIALQPDGRVVAVDAGLDFQLIRFSPDGELDVAFGTNGRTSTDFGDWDFVTGIATDASGSIVAAGTTGYYSRSSIDLALTRYLPGPDDTVPSHVSISGRVTPSYGRGISNASVTLTDSRGVLATTRTDLYGFYTFDNVRAGESYSIQVKAKRNRFTELTITPDEDLSEVNFVGLSTRSL